MDKRKHLFYLLEKDGRSLTVVNNTVTARAQPTPLRFNPVGHKSVTILWERDREKFGTLRTFSTDLEFIKEAAKILRKTHHTETEEREIYLLIQRLYTFYTPLNFQEKHLFVYKGLLDLYTAEDRGNTVKVNLAQNPLTKALAAKEGTDFDFPLNSPDCVTVYHDGIFLYMTQKFLLPKSSPLNGGDDGLHLLGVEPISAEGESGSFTAHSVFYAEDEPSFSDMVGDARYFMRTATAIQGVRLKGSVKIIPARAGGSHRLEIRTSKGRTISLGSVNTPSLGRYTIPFDVTINTQDDERFFLFGIRQGISTFKVVGYEETSMDVSFKSRQPPSYVNAYPLEVLNQKLVEKITGTPGNAVSNLLDQNKGIVATSGNGLRVLPDAVLKTNYKAFFQSVKVIFAAGQSIEQEKVRIETIGRYFDRANPIDLGNVDNFVSSVANEYIFTELKFGYEPQNIEGVNGKSSFHNTSTFSTPRNLAEQRTLSLVCPYIADPFAQEILRIRLADKNTTDSSTDNKVYLLDTETAAPDLFNMAFAVENGVNVIRFLSRNDNWALIYRSITISGTGTNDGTFTITARAETPGELRIEVTEPVTPGTSVGTVAFSVRRLRRPNLTLTGVPDPGTIYNVLLSPSYIIRRWQDYINGCFFRLEGKNLPFEGTDKNKDVSFTYQGQTYTEKAPLTIGNTRLFITRFFNFSVPAPRNMNELLEAQPNRSFTFRARGVQLFGFITKASIGLTDGKEQEFRLLSTPDSDISKLA